MSTGAKEALQVLFCGEEFTWGFKFSKEALDAEPDIEARPLSYALSSPLSGEGMLLSMVIRNTLSLACMMGYHIV